LVFGNGRQETDAHFGLMIEGNGGEFMLQKWIAKTVESDTRKTGGVGYAAFEQRDDLLKENTFDPRRHFRVIEALADGDDAEGARIRDQGTVRAVKYADFAQVIGCYIVGEDNSGMIDERSLRLDGPKGEGFSAEKERIGGFKRMCDRRARDNPINQIVDPLARVGEPTACSGGHAPEPGLAENEIAELAAVFFNEFAGDDERCGCAGIVAGQKHIEKFGRE